MFRKTVSGIMLALLLASMLILAFNIQPVKSWNGTVYIMADGSIDPPDAPIQRNGDLYTLTDNITSAADGVVIFRSGMTFDGAGYTIQARGVYGIVVVGGKNVTVRNTQVKAFVTGLTLEGSSNSWVVGNNITNSTIGIDLHFSANNNSVSGNTVTNNDLGINLLSSGNSVSGNNIADNHMGMWLDSSSNYSSISDNNITGNGEGIHVHSSSNSSIYHNNFVNNTRQVYSDASTNVWDDGYPSGGNYWSDYAGADMKNGPSQDQSGSDGIGDTPYAIDANNADHYPLMKPYLPFDNSTIYIRADGSVDPSGAPILRRGNTYSLTSNIAGNYETGEYGIVIERSHVIIDGENHILEGNGSSVGFAIINVNNVTVCNLVISDFQMGVGLANSSLDTLFGNEIKDCGTAALLLESTSVSMYENGFLNNIIGIYFFLQCSQNMFYHNNFINNTDGHVYFWTYSVLNSWNGSYPLGGNYWSGYKDVDLHSGSSQTDLGGDGIWDNPYVLDANNADRYPLVNPWVAQGAPSFWVVPVAMTFQTNTVSVGHLFNVTVCGEALNGTQAWECTLGFNATQLQAVAAGYTAGAKSELFAGHTTISVQPIIDNSAGTINFGEALYIGDYIGATSGSLFWVTFNITAAPAHDANLTSLIDPGYGVVAGGTCFLDTNWNIEPGLSTAPCTYTYINVPMGLVVRGEDNRIYYRAYDFPTDSWTGWNVLPGATCDSPGAAMYQNQIYIVVRGMDGNTLWCGSVDLSTYVFSGWSPLDGATSSAPTLTSNGTVLCLVVRGLDDRVYYRTYSGSWGAWQAVPTGATPDAPTASMLGNYLHIVVRGMDQSSLWDTIVSCDGAVVRDWSLLSGATPSKPVLACSGADSLCLVVRGMDNAIYYRNYTGSTDSWAGWNALPTGATIDGPGATVMGNMLCTVVRGSDGNTLWSGDIDLGTSSFSGWTLLDGATPSAPTLTS